MPIEVIRRVLGRLRRAGFVNTPRLPTSVIEAPEHRESLTLVSDDRAPGTARSFARAMLTAWGFEDVMDRTVLIVSELTTNAERHGGSRTNAGGSTAAAANGEADHLTLTIAVQGSVVGIEVEDNSLNTPAPRRPSPEELGGRGLLLVAAEADSWTVCPKEDGSGKRVLAFVRRRGPTPAA